MKIRERYKSGDMRPNKDDARRVAMWNEIKHKGERFALDPRWKTRWGEMFFLGRITETQVEAADRWAAMLVRYDQLNDYHRSSSPHPYERKDRGRGNEQDIEVADDAFMKRFMASHAVLCQSGKLAEAAVSKMCRGEIVIDIYHQAIRVGLDALVKFYGLDRLRKAG